MSLKSGVRKKLAEAQAPRDVVEGRNNSNSHRNDGNRRRMADSGAGSDTKNPLIDTFELKWSNGNISAKIVEETIGGATAQRASPLPSLSSPAHPQNFQRSPSAALGHLGGVPRFTWARMPTTFGDKFHPLLCAHDWFRSLFRKKQCLWESSVRSHVGTAERHWDELQESDALRDHPETVD